MFVSMSPTDPQIHHQPLINLLVVLRQLNIAFSKTIFSSEWRQVGSRHLWYTISTQFHVFRRQSTLPSMSSLPISSKVNSLSVFFDPHFTFDIHPNDVAKVYNFHARCNARLHFCFTLTSFLFDALGLPSIWTTIRTRGTACDQKPCFLILFPVCRPILHKGAGTDMCRSLLH